jgi:hypothetical protein
MRKYRNPAMSMLFSADDNPRRKNLEPMTFTGLDVPQEASSSVNTIKEPPSRKVPLVAAVAASGRHGFRKEVWRAIRLVEGFGVEGDAHGVRRSNISMTRRKTPTALLSGKYISWKRNLSLSSTLGFCVAAGDLGENITSRHVHLAGLDAGTVLDLDPARASRSQAFVRPA